MSTAARKARKRAGIKFVHRTKIGTPVTERAWFNALIPDTRRGRLGKMRLRSAKKRAAALVGRSDSSTIETKEEAK